MISSNSSSSSSNGQILCFEHCGKKVFSLWRLPEACPNCSTHLLDCDLKIPPFAVPSPFKKALEFPCAIVIKPTKGMPYTIHHSSDSIIEYYRIKSFNDVEQLSCDIASLSLFYRFDHFKRVAGLDPVGTFMFIQIKIYIYIFFTWDQSAFGIFCVVKRK